MVQKRREPDQPPSLHFIADDERSAVTGGGRGQLIEQSVAVAIVIRQNLSLDPLRTILQAALPVGTSPEAGEQYPNQWRERSKILVLEKPRFETA
jgi:hypothetical protein